MGLGTVGFGLKKYIVMTAASLTLLNPNNTGNTSVINSFSDQTKVMGEFRYTYGDNESLAQAKEICRRGALKNALESAMIFVSSDVRINTSGIDSLDIRSFALGAIKHVESIDESVNDRDVHCRIKGIVDIPLMEERLKDYLSANRITPGKKVKIKFAHAVVEKGSYSRDDSNPAPDIYLLIKDKYGNIVYASDNQYLRNRKYIRLLENRNNYFPDFEDNSLEYTFARDNYLEIYLVDWDGMEGFLGSRQSKDDIIGKPYRLGVNHELGKRFLKAKGWGLEVEIVKSEDDRYKLAEADTFPRI